tara:strand:- start:1564 stop:1866 length:303 start_codon:yes stop_codon:yes gene_type:complete
MDKEKPELSELENMELEESDEFEEDEETDILDSPSGITAHPGTFLIEVFVDSQVRELKIYNFIFLDVLLRQWTMSYYLLAEIWSLDAISKGLLLDLKCRD